jgi:hypothetical protein
VNPSGDPVPWFYGEQAQEYLGVIEDIVAEKEPKYGC